jgi:hypothetical protein
MTGWLANFFPALDRRRSVSIPTSQRRSAGPRLGAGSQARRADARGRYPRARCRLLTTSHLLLASCPGWEGQARESAWRAVLRRAGGCGRPECPGPRRRELQGRGELAKRAARAGAGCGRRRGRRHVGASCGRPGCAGPARSSRLGAAGRPARQQGREGIVLDAGDVASSQAPHRQARRSRPAGGPGLLGGVGLDRKEHLPPAGPEAEAAPAADAQPPIPQHAR